MTSKAQAFNEYEAVEIHSGFDSKNRSLLDPEFDIFKPFATLQKGEHVIITTWGVAPPEYMIPVLNELKRASHVHLLVGYSKQTHDLNAQYQWLLKYWTQWGIRVHLLPGAHSKIWIIDKRIWCGSQNFVQGGAPNYMAKVHPYEQRPIEDHVREMLKAAQDFSKTTKLELVKPAYGHYRNATTASASGETHNRGSEEQNVPRKGIRGPLRPTGLEWPGSQAFGGDVWGGF